MAAIHFVLSYGYTGFHENMCLLLLVAIRLVAQTAPAPANPETAKSVTVETKETDAPVRRLFPPPDSITENTVTIGGQKVAYQAVAGTITVGATDAYDSLLAPDGQLLPDAAVNPPIRRNRKTLRRRRACFTRLTLRKTPHLDRGL